MKLVSRYAAVGIWNSIFGVSNFIVLSRFMLQAPDVLVLGISYGISIVQAHFSQRNIVWRSKAEYLPELLKFSSAYLLQFFINTFLLLLSEGLFGLSREIRQMLIVVFLTVVFYFVNKRGVFRVK
jgi:putative flippase GtrA